MFDFEERELKELDLKNPILRSGWRSSRRPRSPSSNHNVKELPSSANFHLAREATPPARQCPAGGVGAVYRGSVSPCQTPNCSFIAFFVNAGNADEKRLNATFAPPTPIWCARIRPQGIENAHCGKQSG
jgi:hypothetical protein